jgi:hypothetical protein
LKPRQRPTLHTVWSHAIGHAVQAP